jgi:gliding motility-associated-like protein
MRLLFLSILTLFSFISSAQLMNNEGLFYVAEGAVVAVKGTDFHNAGVVRHKGYLLVDRHIHNDALWKCDSIAKNTIEFGGNWFNDSNFNPGFGQVNLIGNNQTIGGSKSTNYYGISLLGAPLSVKSLVANITVEDKLDLNNAELACRQSSATMNLKSKEIARSKGFVSTLIDGRLNREFQDKKNTFSFFPLGYNDRGKVIMKPIVVVKTDSGTFRTAFLYDNASIYGMNTNSLDDSLCTVNDEYFHIVGSDHNSKSSFGLVTGDEYSWSKLGNWKGPWTKITNSSYQDFGKEEAFGVRDYTVGDDQPIVLATERPFIDIVEELVYVPYKDTYEIKTKHYSPEHSTLLWSPPDHLSCDDCPNPIYTAGLPGLYTVEIDNSFGCTASDTIRIQVVRGKGDENPTLIPNAFSPNFDGLNDIFLPHLYSFEELVNLTIYNRWGQKIYEGTEGWDGTFMGKPVQLGSYLYKVEIKELIKNGYHRNIHLSGILTIIR